MLRLLWAHAVLLPVYGLSQGVPASHSVLEGIVIGALALASMLGGRRLGDRWRAAMVALGLITASAVLVHMSGGYIEAHFHFFVVIIMLSLYEDWLPFLIAFGYVVVHHGAIGAVDAGAVYNHPSAVNHPWRWALIHGAFVSAAGIAAIIAWRLNELSRERAADADARAEERSRHAAELQRREQAVRQIIDSAHDAYIQVDEHSTISEWNPQAEATFGYSREEALGRPLPELIIPRELRERHYEGVKHFLATGEGPVLGKRLELPALHSDGHEFPVEITISALKGADDRYRFHAFLHDISERKHLEERTQRAHHLERRQRQAYELNDSVVQRLAVANLAFALGRTEQAAEAVTDALEAAKRIINDWAGDSPGDLRRDEPALPSAQPGDSDV